MANEGGGIMQILAGWVITVKLEEADTWLIIQGPDGGGVAFCAPSKSIRGEVLRKLSTAMEEESCKVEPSLSAVVDEGGL